MFKNWKARLSFSSTAYIPANDPLHEGLLEEDNEQSSDSNLGLQQKPPPLLIYWVIYIKACLFRILVQLLCRYTLFMV
jgi:hypothetical protein